MSIPRRAFKRLIEEKKAVPGRGGIMHTVRKLLEQYAATLEELEEMSHFSRRQVTSALSKLRAMGLKIDKYFNTEDARWYYYLSD